MKGSPFDKAVEDKAQHHCESCRHMRQRQPWDVKVEAGHEHDTHWCGKLDIPTVLLACRCGGDDWESIPTEEERKAAEANVDHALFEYNKRHGMFHTINLLIDWLVKLQRHGTVNRAEYQGDDFKVVVTTRKRK